MKEIGGYIELDTYNWTMLHEGAVTLNSGRNCLAYLIQAKKIKKIAIPYFLCNSIKNVCVREKIELRFYHIGIDFFPLNITLQEDEWMYIVNFYGQLDNSALKIISKRYKRVIIDNAQAYFQMPIENMDTIYTCRKFFGVSDGAFLYTDIILESKLVRDKSYDRIRSLLGRFERSASEFYDEHVKNENIFGSEPIKRMSRLTENLLHAINYKIVEQQRTRNFALLHKELSTVNKLVLRIPKGAFMYPLYIPKGAELRKSLIAEKIYIPMLWPEVLDNGDSSKLECDMAQNILPLPVDQRYSIEEMGYLVDKIKVVM